jgi:chorismate synthase
MRRFLPDGGAFSFRRNMFSRNNQERLEKQQERIDSGFMSKHFPGVAGIVVNMIYNQRGEETVHRTLNFYPSSYAFFRVDCLSADCVNGGFDLTQVIHAMIRNHREVSKGELSCDDNGPRPGHANIAYEIAIQYA